jgi:hypothetical protein
MNDPEDSLEFCNDWDLLFNVDYVYPKSISFFQHWKLYQRRKKLMKDLKEYRSKNPYKCFTVKLIMSKKYEENL